MTDSKYQKATQWVRGQATDGLGDEDKRVILAVAHLAADGTGVVVDEDRLAEHADVSIVDLWLSLRRLQQQGLLASVEATMAGRLRLALPIPGIVTVIKSDDR